MAANKKIPVLVTPVLPLVLPPVLVPVPPVLVPVPPVPAIDNTYRILSFDVGIRHLAYCYLAVHKKWDVSSCQILSWNVIDLGPVGNVETCALSLMKHLQGKFYDTSADIVLIERQPKARSIIMVAVQMFLCAFFTLRVVVTTAPKEGGEEELEKVNNTVDKVKFISASWKLQMAQSSKLLSNADDGSNNNDDGATTTNARASKTTAAATKRVSYANNKKYAIDTARHYLEHVLQDFGNLTILDMFKKKDDLCDALLQALAYVEEGSTGIRAQMSRYKRRSRKDRPKK